VLGGAATIRPDRGILLNTTWRMHPDVCAFVSLASYDGKLESDPDCTRQSIAAPGALTGSGIVFQPVHHWGNRTSSPEEIATVRALVSDLLRGTWTDKRGRTRAVALEDMLVVAPFNAHVARLKAALPPGARVGTVDKFQGQEAPVVLVSMACSAVAEAPRGAEFLLNRNRINVAVSRGQWRAVIIRSPELTNYMPAKPAALEELGAFIGLSGNHGLRPEQGRFRG
jgi:superfamily I DNA and/or RNA helicase